MATGKSGYLDFTSSNNAITVRVNWAETYDISANSSTVRITSVEVMSPTYYEVLYYLDGSIQVNSSIAVTMKSQTPTHTVYVKDTNVFATVDGSGGTVGNIAHNSDGSKSVSIEVDVAGYTENGNNGNGWKVKGVKSVDLTTIARVSVPTLSAGAVVMKNQVTIYTNRMDTSLTHTLEYVFGNASGTIATGVGDSFTWSVPDLASRIPGLTQSVCTITCITYAGGVPVGKNSVPLTISVPSATVPRTSNSSVQMGKSITIYTSRKSSAFTHTISYKVGGKTGIIANKATDSVLWTPSTDLAAYTGNNTSATCTITCATYNGSALVGETSINIQLVVPNATAVSLSASSIELGKSITLNTPKGATVYTHDLTYNIEGYTGTIATDVESSYAWTVPSSLANRFPTKTSASVMVLCTTRFKNSSSVVGTSTATFTVTVPNNEETKPQASMSLTCVSSLPSKFSGVYVAGRTQVKVSYDARSNSSDIASYKTTILGVTGEGNPYTSPLLNGTGQVSISGRVEDKRGFFTTVTDSISIEPYSRPRIVPYEGENSIICTRCDSGGKLNVSGTWLLIKIGRMYSSVGGKNTCKLSYRHKPDSSAQYSDPIELLSASASSDYVSVVLPNIVPSITTAYTIQILAEDDVGESDVITFVIPTIFVTAHSPDGGHGITFGGYHDEARYDWFVCNFDAHFRGEILVGETGKTLKEYILSVIQEGG